MNWFEAARERFGGSRESFRNRENPGDQHSITMSDTEIMRKARRRLINLLHPRT